MKSDFNFYDAFRFLDLNANGYITIDELKKGLGDMGVYASYDELDLFIKRYDKNRDGMLRFSEFCDAFTPIDPYYISMLNRRGTGNLRASMYNRGEVFSMSTTMDLKEVWRTHLRVEASAERLR
jgi:hypothetical protein